ncbi:unnamed protein product, partial [Nesidiocoris tenuis]
MSSYVSEPAEKAVCPNCLDEIAGLRVRCATCEDIEICLQCYSGGCEIGTHTNDHPYQFVDAGTGEAPANRTKWTARDHLQLVNCIIGSSIDLWADIVKNHFKNRTPEEVEEEYEKRFLGGSIGNVTWDRPPEKRVCLIDETKNNQGPLLSALAPSLDITPEEAAFLGYMPWRDDFEKEYDNEAEKLLDPAITDSMTPGEEDDLEQSILLARLDMYSRRVQERFRRKRIIRDYHLVSQFHSNKKPKRSVGEQEVEDKLRWLCQLQTAQEHTCLVKNIQRQRDLQQRLSELLRYRKNGLTRIEELPHFVQEFRSSKGSSGSSSLTSLTATVIRRSEKNGGSDHCFTTKSCTFPTVSRSSSHRTELEQLLRPQLQQQTVLPNGLAALSHPLLTEQSRHLLSDTEVKLCSTLDLSPSQYLSIKTLLLL